METLYFGGVLIFAALCFGFWVYRKYDFEEYCFDEQMKEEREIRILKEQRYKTGVDRDKDALAQVNDLRTQIQSLETKMSFAMTELNKGRRI